MLSEQPSNKMRPLSHNAVPPKPQSRPLTAGSTKSLQAQGKLYKGSTLSKHLSINQFETNNIPQRVRPSTTGGIQLQSQQNQQQFGLTIQTKSSLQSLFQKPQTAGSERISQSTQFGKPHKVVSKPEFDLNIIESEVYPKVYFIKNAEKVPFSKCCNSPVHIELFESGGGKIACSEPNCIASLLTDFALNLQENQTLWKDKYTIAQTTNIQESKMIRQKISRLITTGFFKHKSITREFKKLQSTNNHDNNYQLNQLHRPVSTQQLTRPLNIVNTNQEFQDYQLQDVKLASNSNKFKQPLRPYGLRLHESMNDLTQRQELDEQQNKQTVNGMIQENNKNNSQPKEQGQQLKIGESPNYNINSVPQKAKGPQIRLKSGFKRDKKDIDLAPKFLDSINLFENSNSAPNNYHHKQNLIHESGMLGDEEGSLLEIKNMINDFLS